MPLGGRLMYLIEYSRRNIANYSVRAYDMRARRLFRAPVVDPDEAGEPMTGVPVTGVSGARGRWAYTLYDGSPHPFVHALDSERRTAVCIDLDHLRRGMWGATLRLRGPRLDVVGRAGRLLAAIDTRAHRLIRRPAPRTEDANSSWPAMAASTAALVLLLGACRATRACGQGEGGLSPEAGWPPTRGPRSQASSRVQDTGAARGLA
jgi:hypothetical protein